MSGKANATDGLFCNGVEECIAGDCVSGADPCDENEICNEAYDQCFPDDCDEKWDLNGDCIVDKEDSKTLKLQQKAEKTNLKVQHKAEKDEIKASIGFSEECGMGWDIDGSCDVDKEDAKLLKLQQKTEKTVLKNKHKSEKESIEAALW